MSSCTEGRMMLPPQVYKLLEVQSAQSVDGRWEGRVVQETRRLGRCKSGKVIDFTNAELPKIASGVSHDEST